MLLVVFFFFVKQKTAYEMRISDWSSDVCSSDLLIEVEPVSAYEVGLASARERLQPLGREAGIADEQPARPRCLSTDLARKGHQVGKADLRPMPFCFNQVRLT